MIYYYLLTILVSNLVTPTEDDLQIAADIREGQINSFLTKPLSYLGYRTSIFLGGRLVYTAVTIIPIALIFFLLPEITFNCHQAYLPRFVDYFARHGRVHSVFHHLLARDDGVLDTGNLHYRFHRLLIRILPRRPDVSDRHHANRRASSDEMAAILLRAILSDRNLSWAACRVPNWFKRSPSKSCWLIVTWAVAQFMWKRGLGHYQAVGG